MDCVVGRLTNLRDHPEIPYLQVAEVAGHAVVVGRHYEEGNLGFYIPDGAILTEKLLREMWLWNEETGKGRLAGKQGNRAKSRLVGGQPSEGLFYGACYFHEGKLVESASWDPAWVPGDVVTEKLGIEIP